MKTITTEWVDLGSSVDLGKYALALNKMNRERFGDHGAGHLLFRFYEGRCVQDPNLSWEGRFGFEIISPEMVRFMVGGIEVFESFDFTELFYPSILLDRQGNPIKVWDSDQL